MKVEIKRKTGPIQSVSLEATGGGKIHLGLYKGMLETFYSSPGRSPHFASFNKQDLAQYIEILTELYDQM